MCGFLGQFNVTEAALPQAELEHLLRLSQLRGPDDSQYYTNGKNLWLGFNRLAILDTSKAGAQPMRSKNDRLTIVFNGEIYNHLELRQKLRFKKWRGHSDTETILMCVEEWGFSKTIDLLDGMFALAIYDRVENAIYCARDFAGIKPFFFGWNGKNFVFASQYDQIIRHPVFAKNEIDLQVLRLYLEQHFMPAPFGIIKQTGQLEPGQWLRVSARGLEKRKYWQFPEFVEPEIFDERKAAQIIGESFSESVSAEMLSDVPLGAFLSGGIDSPLICHYAAQHSRQKLQTFTVGSDSKIHDESEKAQEYAEIIQTDHYCEMMTADSAFKKFDAVLNCIREPMADFSIIPTYLVSKFARKKVTVALSGDGGDELFFGYERFWSVAKNIKYQQLPWIIKAAIYKSDQILTSNKNVNSVLLSSRQSSAHRGLHSRFSNDLINNLFPDLANITAPPTYATYDYPNTRNSNKLVQAMRKAEFYGMMQKTLRKVDLASMGNSLEIRVPFLKKSFIETTLKIDPALSYGISQKKRLLKSHLREIYPELCTDNIKRGFTVPLGKWINERKFQQQITEKLVKKDFVARYGIQEKAVRQIINENGMGKDNKWSIFTLIALQQSVVNE